MWENSHKVYLSWKVHKSVVSTIYRLSKEISLGEKELKMILLAGFYYCNFHSILEQNKLSE